MKISLFNLFLLLGLTVGALDAQTFEWARQAGGINYDQAYSVAVDASDNTYVVGLYCSPLLSFGEDTITGYGYCGFGWGDMFIVKYGPSGNVLWAKGQQTGSVGSHITADNSNNLFVVGSFVQDTIIFGTDTVYGGNDYDMFIVKYDSLGTVLWARGTSGDRFVSGRAVSVDNDGNSIVVGGFGSSILTVGMDTLVNTGDGEYSLEVFIVKYDPGGNVLWAKSGSGTGSKPGSSVAVDKAGNIYVLGSYSGPNISFGADSLTNAGGTDMFLVKFDPDGDVLWLKGGGGVGWDGAATVTVDKHGNAFVVGEFDSPSIRFGSDTLTNSGGGDIFIVKYNPEGDVLWVRGAGGSESDHATAVTVDNGENAYVVGSFQSARIGFGSDTLTNTGGLDIFIAKYNREGDVLWAMGAGGSEDDGSVAVTVDSYDNPYLVGNYASPAITFGSSTLTNVGGSDVFIVRLAGGTTGVHSPIDDVPGSYNLKPNYPNPFNPSTEFYYSLPQAGDVTLKIYDLLGREVATLVNERQVAGSYAVRWNAVGWPSGIYIYRLTAGEFTKSEKMVLMK